MRGITNSNTSRKRSMEAVGRLRLIWRVGQQALGKGRLGMRERISWRRMKTSQILSFVSHARIARKYRSLKAVKIRVKAILMLEISVMRASWWTGTRRRNSGCLMTQTTAPNISVTKTTYATNSAKSATSKSTEAWSTARTAKSAPMPSITTASSSPSAYLVGTLSNSGSQSFC